MTATTTQSTTTRAADWFGAAARSLAPLPLIMSFFLLFYAFWFIPAWGVPGAIVFGLLLVFVVPVSIRAVGNIRHALRFENIVTPDGARMGKRMGALSGITYPVLWLSAGILALVGHAAYIVPVVVIVIGLHFIPMARILGRRIDYLLGPLSTAFGVVGVVLVATGSPWQLAAGIAGVGGAIATFTYALYTLRGYRTMAIAAGAA